MAFVADPDVEIVQDKEAANAIFSLASSRTTGSLMSDDTAPPHFWPAHMGNPETSYRRLLSLSLALVLSLVLALLRSHFKDKVFTSKLSAV